MGCNCGGNRVGAKVVARGQGGKKVVVKGFQVCYDDGTCTPADQPLFSIVEARRLVREAGGGTVHRLVQDAS